MILLTVFIASIVLPDFYKTSFKRNVKYVSLNYSEVTKQFVIWGLKDGVLLDTLGNEYSRQEYERMVPFSSMPQLLKRNEFPDTVAGVPVTPQLVAENNYRHREFNRAGAVLRYVSACSRGNGSCRLYLYKRYDAGKPEWN